MRRMAGSAGFVLAWLLLGTGLLLVSAHAKPAWSQRGFETYAVESGQPVKTGWFLSAPEGSEESVAPVAAESAGISVMPTNLTVSEPDGTAQFRLTLTSPPTAVVSIPLQAPSNQCDVSPGSVNLDAGNWSSGVTATVTAEDDFVVDGLQICLVQTGPSASADPLYDGLNPSDVTVRVLDDDKRGIVVTPTALTISEPDGTGQFTLTLTSQPLAAITVPLSAVGDECTVSPSSLSIPVAAWASGVPATVTAVDDARPDGPKGCLVQTGPASSSGDPGYVGLDAEDVMVIVLDDEQGMQVYMPLVLRGWPAPPPAAPFLEPIENADGDGNYTVRWSSVGGAALYILERGEYPSFSAPVQVYVGSSTSYTVTEQVPGLYLYRVKARNYSGDSGYSNIESVCVLFEVEPNDQASQANGPLVSGRTYCGILPESDPQDYYFFDVPVAHTIEVMLSHIAVGQNYDLVLRDTNLAELAYSGNLGNAAEHILTGVLPAGRYLIQVYHRSLGGSTQPYYLTVVFE